MYCQWVILLLIIFTENKLATAGTNNTESCGKLSSKLVPVKAGNNATLVYVPDKNYVNSSRKWTRLSSDSTKDVLVFDSANTSSMSSTYIEGPSQDGYTLIIQEVTLDDAGAYVVTCSNQPTYSNPFNLTITDDCGSLSSSPVYQGSDATLVYTPSTKYLNSTRKWSHRTYGVVFDSGDNSNRSAKYIEAFTGKGYNLTIKEADAKDIGAYDVMCSQNPPVNSFVYILNVYSYPPNTTVTADKPTDPTAKFDTTMITVHDATSQLYNASEDPLSRTRYTVTNDKNKITYRTTKAYSNTSGEDEQLTPSSKSTQTYTSTGPADTTFKSEANEPTTYLTTKAMSTTTAKDEKLKPSIDNAKTYMSMEPAKTTFITKVTPRNQKNDDVPTKGKPEDTTTQKVHRVTTTITSDEKSRNIDQVTLRNQENNGEPTTRKPEDTTTQKAHRGSSEGANDEPSSNSTAITITVVVFIVVAIAVVFIVVTVMKRKERKHKIPKGSQQRAHYSRNNDMTGKTGNFKTLEIPEYAKVIPKEQRTIEVKQETSEKTRPRSNNTETNNQLLYAELDLQPIGTFSTFKQSADQNKATEDVSVDFTKTGNIQANGSTPEKNVATEYVSIDFTKTGTIQGNENTQEKNVATENVSVDFTKTGTIQENEGKPEKNEATEHVSLDLTKTGTIQGNEKTPENNEASENVSEDFTKRGSIQENEGALGKNEATTHVSVDFTKTGTIQRNEDTPENNGATENVSISLTKMGTSQENSPEK